MMALVAPAIPDVLAAYPASIAGCQGTELPSRSAASWRQQRDAAEQTVAKAFTNDRLALGGAAVALLCGGRRAAQRRLARRRLPRAAVALQAGAATSPLSGRIAAVTGASRGVGRGCAVALGEKGMTVYVSGRSQEDLEKTASAVRAAGGEAVVVVTDHADDASTKAFFKKIEEEQGRLDVLVCNAYQQAGKEADTALDEGKKFDGLPLEVYDRMMFGPRACYASMYYAADLLRSTARLKAEGDEPSPLVTLIGGFGALSPAGRQWLSSAYATSKVAVDRLARDLHSEFRVSTDVPPERAPCVISAVPGIVYTERVQEMIADGSAEIERITGGQPPEVFCESPILTGRVTALFAENPEFRCAPYIEGPCIHNRMSIVAEVARSLGIKDGGKPGTVAFEMYGAERDPAPSIRTFGYLGPFLLKANLPDFLKPLADVGGPLANPDWKIPLDFYATGDAGDV
eukprot:TRINITY_DN92723_c0_g1_i1.p1 TRINITY_DN92723_c0_g1~~TRINITY_DN92723_c0_g1_i1.p1  ORF type:complete len:459 (+),score=79.68 TRINITY_DN92723_c0_g1_i1:52-1428(+)